jgi:hypothetical protein
VAGSSARRLLLMLFAIVIIVFGFCFGGSMISVEPGVEPVNAGTKICSAPVSFEHIAMCFDRPNC